MSGIFVVRGRNELAALRTATIAPVWAKATVRKFGTGPIRRYLKALVERDTTLQPEKESSKTIIDVRKRVFVQ